jgi:hypothetical protein
MQIPRADSLSPFSIKILTKMYQKLSFQQRDQIFELFLPENAQFPKMNPPYHSSIFLVKGKHIISSIYCLLGYYSSIFSVKGNHIISSIYCLLGYYSDEWVDEPILGFLSTFSTKETVFTFMLCVGVFD